jgi:aminoglycoside/choline kinase family phosphotransferase
MPSQNLKKKTPSRRTLKNNFLVSQGWHHATSSFLAGDASYRKYERLSLPDGTKAILMDAPLPYEKPKSFEQVAQLLLNLGYSAPEIYGIDLENGFLLLEDLGDSTYPQFLEDKSQEEPLYALAIDLLADLHKRFQSHEALPPYTFEEYLREANLFLEWYFPAIMGEKISDVHLNEYKDIWKALVKTLETLPSSIVLRDYHIDNLMWLSNRPGLQACGLLDFQDALIGSVAYDLVSLLEDARRDVTPSLQRAMTDRYLSHFPDLDQDNFRSVYSILGAQRNAKIIGIFTRLAYRDQKERYLDFIPRVWGYLHQDLQNPALKPLKDWLDKMIPMEKRSQPPAPKTRKDRTFK